jgi:hypothetical protein
MKIVVGDDVQFLLGLALDVLRLGAAEDVHQVALVHQVRDLLAGHGDVVEQAR